MTFHDSVDINSQHNQKVKRKIMINMQNPNQRYIFDQWRSGKIISATQRQSALHPKAFVTGTRDSVITHDSKKCNETGNSVI